VVRAGVLRAEEKERIRPRTRNDGQSRAAGEVENFTYTSLGFGGRKTSAPPPPKPMRDWANRRRTPQAPNQHSENFMRRRTRPRFSAAGIRRRRSTGKHRYTGLRVVGGKTIGIADPVERRSDIALQGRRGDAPMNGVA